MPALRSPRALASAAASVALAVLLLGAGFPSPAFAAAPGEVGWTVQTVDNDNGAGRGSFSYELDPGQSVTDAMRVVNTGTVALPLDVYAADAFTTAGGDVDLVTGGAANVDAGAWVSVAVAAITLQPGEQADIPFTITVPVGATPGDHAAGLVSSLVSQDAGQTLSVDRRLGTRVNVRVAGDLAPAASIENVRASYASSWNPFDAGVLTVQYDLRNTGNTLVTGLDTVDAAGPAGLLSTASPGARVPEIIPGSAVELRREFGVLSLGWLSGSVTVSPEAVGLGAEVLAPVTVGYSAVAVPWSLAALLVLVAGVVAGAILLVRRRSRDREAVGATVAGVMDGTVGGVAPAAVADTARVR